jgi:hypothetical protein
MQFVFLLFNVRSENLPVDRKALDKSTNILKEAANARLGTKREVDVKWSFKNVINWIWSSYEECYVNWKNAEQAKIIIGNTR